MNDLTGATAGAPRVYPDQLPTAIKIMSEEVAKHPAELTPLIKSATVKLAERRAARGGRQRKG